MSKFQIFNIKPFSGTSKSGNAYEMLIVSGVFTGEDGTCELGEISFMKGNNRPLPVGLEVGKTYEPSITASSRDGKLTFSIASLTPINENRASAVSQLKKEA